MTDLIDLDLGTLANLGQHFSSKEETADVRRILLSVQNDIDKIKTFLTNLHGSDFSDLMTNCKNDMDKLSNNGKRRSTTVSKVEGTTHESMKLSSSVAPNGKQQQRLRPQLPLLQPKISSRLNQPTFNFMAESQLAGSAGDTPKEKFHRNFLMVGASPKNKVGNTNNSLISRSHLIPVKTQTISDLRSLCKQGNVTTTNSANRRHIQSEKRSQTIKYESFDVAEATPNFATRENNEDENFGEDFDIGNGTICDSQQYDDYYEENGKIVMNDKLALQNSMSQDAYDSAMESMNYEYMDANASYEVESGCEYIDEEFSLTVTPIMKTGRQDQSESLSTGARLKQQLTRRNVVPTLASSGTVQVEPSIDENDTDPSFLKKCKVCHEEVPAFALFSHVVNVHYKGEVPTCQTCNKTFTYKQGLISHMRYHDAGKYDKACSYCGKKFIRRSDVVIHERRLHTGERPWRCPVPQCNQGFVRRYCLLTHVKTNHGEPYMSQIAAQSTSRRKSN